MPNDLLSFSLAPLNPHFVGPKPIESAPEELVQELDSKGKLILTRKRNGYSIYTAVTGSGPQRIGFYTRGIDDITVKFPSLAEEVRNLNIPPDTLLIGEMLVEANGADAPGLYTSIVKSNPLRAIELQKKNPVRIALFNVAVHKGKPVIHLPYQDRLDIIRELTAGHGGGNISVVEEISSGLEAARSLSRESKWEGLVLYDKDAGSTFAIDARGKTPRPEGCWKWKEYNEGDFVATGFAPSTAKSHAGAVKDLHLAQYNPETGELENWGVCGIGISTAERYAYADPAVYPLVFEVKFERRTANRKLILAQILRRRLDKKPEECFSPADWRDQL